MELKDKIRDAANDAWKVHEMAGALEVMHNALPATIPDECDQIERQAFNALPMLIEQLMAMTERLAGQIETLGDVPKGEGAQG